MLNQPGWELGTHLTGLLGVVAGGGELNDAYDAWLGRVGVLFAAANSSGLPLQLLELPHPLSLPSRQLRLLRLHLVLALSLLCLAPFFPLLKLQSLVPQLLELLVLLARLYFLFLVLTSD